MRVRDFFNIIREISFTHLQYEAMTPPRFLLVAPSHALATSWRAAIFGDESARFVDLAAHGEPADPFAFDAIISVGVMDREIARDWFEQSRRIDHDLRIVEVEPTLAGNELQIEALRRRICDKLGDRALAVGRYLPAFRYAAAAEIVADTSRVNAQFAAVSNIPALVPVVGTLLSAGADFLVLTKNQLMMIFKLAAVYGRDLDDRWRIYSEMIPVVGAALAWRTVARQVAGLMPLLIGAAPKVVIAYAGTYVVGHGARYYFEHGEKLTREQLDSIYRDALGSFGQTRIGRYAMRNQAEAVALPSPSAVVKTSS